MEFVTDAINSPQNCKFSRDGELLIVRDGTYELVLMDPVDMRVLVKIKTAHDSRVIHFDLSPDKGKVAFACFENIQILDLVELQSELAKLGLAW